MIPPWRRRHTRAGWLGRSVGDPTAGRAVGQTRTGLPAHTPKAARNDTQLPRFP